MTYRLVLGATGVNRVSRCEGRTRLDLSSDYGYEMLRRTHRDDGIESLVIGARNADPQEPLAGFVADIRFVVDGPVPAPTPALAAVLGGGFSAEGPELPAMPRSAGRRRLRMVAEAAIGLTVAAAVLTVAGAAGALPRAAQEAVASAVAAVSPFELPGQPDEEEADKSVSDDRGIDGESIAEDAARQGAVAGIQNRAASDTWLDRTADTPTAVPPDVSTTATTAEKYRPVETTARRPGAVPAEDRGSTTRRSP